MPMSAAVADPTAEAVETQTEHPYIVHISGVCGGRPIVRGSRVAVWHIARLFKAGYTADEIEQEYPHLPPASIYDAISYYLDYQDEIERDILENRVETVAARHKLSIDERGFLHPSPST
jgi:uncharacterized protein (DUF433 family)